MSVYAVDAEMLADAERRLSDFADHCAEQLRRVEGIVGSNHLRWTGEGASAYESRHSDWVRSAASMREHLVAIQQRAGTARDAYRDALAANSKMFG
ncbi:WXG100 family type VII secretion target [Rhodococcoides yunnanense]|uniref:WXG100 family type VII secretion target n=1 Tax=Rhodococcoides yunnanense TaxID=278209 RepID=UPI000933C1C0|nr:WXG100 family type VII secretion target [Rhodococcus yunnanensis]